ncbi:MAG: hypothetical protein ACRDHY_12530 [Anaerolineales bacterium]
MYTNLDALERIAKSDIKDRRCQADHDHMARLARAPKSGRPSASGTLIRLAVFVVVAVTVAGAL